MSKHAHTNSNKKIKILVIIVIVLALLVAAGAAVFMSRLNDRNSTETKIAETITKKVAGYDIDKLSKTYPDIVGWLDVPNTSASFPIVQSNESDYYYLNHDAQKNLDEAGACYIEMANKKDFSDPVTVMYGHNMNDGSMFHTLHNFENQEFFNNNDKFYVYTKGHKLTYTVAAAYATNDSHILNTHDFSKPEELLKYEQSIMNDLSTTKRVRQGVTLNENSKLLQLSTCMSDPALKNQRFVVTGVLTNDEETL